MTAELPDLDAMGQAFIDYADIGEYLSYVYDDQDGHVESWPSIDTA